MSNGIFKFVQINMKHLLYIEIIYNIGDKTFLYLILIILTVLLKCKMEKRNSQCEHRQPIEQFANKLVLHMQLRCGSLSITTPVSHLVNEFDG